MAGQWDSDKIRQIWDRLAGAWDSNRDLIWSFTREISEHLVDRLDPRPGETILEVGAGTGETGFLVAERIGPSGTLMSTDLSSEMSQAARRAAQRLGLTNVEFRLMDITSLDLPDESVDGVIGRLVYHLVPDPVKAFAEARRVLRHGGRLCYTVFGPDEQVPFDLAIGTTMQRRNLTMPLGIQIDIELNDEATISEVTKAGGFERVDVEPVPYWMRFADDEAAWRYVTDLYGRAAELIRGLPADEQKGFRRDFLGELEPYRTGNGYAVPGLVLNVRAT